MAAGDVVFSGFIKRITSGDSWSPGATTSHSVEAQVRGADMHTKPKLDKNSKNVAWIGTQTRYLSERDINIQTRHNDRLWFSVKLPRGTTKWIVNFLLWDHYNERPLGKAAVCGV